MAEGSDKKAIISRVVLFAVSLVVVVALLRALDVSTGWAAAIAIVIGVVLAITVDLRRWRKRAAERQARG